MYKILVVEDDLEICDVLRHFLARDGNYSVKIVHEAQSALDASRQGDFDIIPLDIMLPGMDGINLCAQLRRHVYCPVIYISCLHDDDTIIKALQMGGDDYLTKPFKCPVLLARIEANLRRMRYGRPLNEQIHEIGNLQIDEKNHTVYKDGENKHLSPTEFQILLLMIHNRGAVLDMEEIYQYIWHRPSCGDVRTVKVHVYNLRKKIETNPSAPEYIKTVKNTGYIFEG
ncbi:MAG TPA: response regulator transcription factor [Desulfitobacterium dehalogenans]|uniref:Stage 0 sporulation protein A homolog n=1 Tax=Desulfitobacterium dehalogenans TaxID=36854 RepID=A0A7C7DBS9_9FIRM|nr:response regulator transcription factor [Desulfitobacterium dehalogenans]